MTEKQISELLTKLFGECSKGNRQAGVGYGELSALYDAWKKRKTHENWEAVVFKAQGVMMWVQGDKPN